MNITITIPDDKKDAVIAAFAAQYGYEEKIEDNNGKEIDNPVSNGQFALGIIETFIKDVYVANMVAVLEEQRKSIVSTASDEMSGLTVE